MTVNMQQAGKELGCYHIILNTLEPRLILWLFKPTADNICSKMLNRTNGLMADGNCFAVTVTVSPCRTIPNLDLVSYVWKFWCIFLFKTLYFVPLDNYGIQRENVRGYINFRPQLYGLLHFKTWFLNILSCSCYVWVWGPSDGPAVDPEYLPACCTLPNRLLSHGIQPNSLLPMVRSCDFLSHFR